MNSLVIAGLCFVGYIIAYHTYGKFLAKKIFQVDESKVCPSCELEDGKDFVPTKRKFFLDIISLLLLDLARSSVQQLRLSGAGFLL